MCRSIALGARIVRDGAAVANNAAARARLLQLAQDLRALPRAMAEKVAPVGAKKLLEILQGNIAAQRGPDGEPWPAGKDGQAVLTGAGKALDVHAEGTVILARVSGPEALHHMGRARGHIVRQMIPTKKAPQAMVDAVKDAMRESMTELLRLQ